MILGPSIHPNIIDRDCNEGKRCKTGTPSPSQVENESTSRDRRVNIVMEIRRVRVVIIKAVCEIRQQAAERETRIRMNAKKRGEMRSELDSIGEI